MSDLAGSSGRITRSIAPDTAVRRTLDFVYAQLPAWRNMPGRPVAEAEEELNGQLCKFLNASARAQDFPMAYFHHEERQTGQRRVDMSALSPQPLIEGRLYFDLNPFLVLEGKRLPAPSRDREREYVVGAEKASGGIQRFKLGLHGATLTRAAMIGYVQDGPPKKWFDRINTWIADLANSDDAFWSSQDRLADLRTASEAGTAECQSSHLRVDCDTSHIQLTHLWVEMNVPVE